MEQFEVPVVLFIFKRAKAVEVLRRIAEVRPKKLYILADSGRTEKEKKEALLCRELVEKEITWECEVVKNYAEENRGVFGNIGLGALWVFEREREAIFLEDDNLPEVTFFRYCKEMLERYRDDTRILWVCGTNYLGSYESEDGASYVFTKHMLPCGWASWSGKFTTFYDTKLENVNDTVLQRKIRREYRDAQLYYQYRRRWAFEHNRMAAGLRPVSWDNHMDFTLKENGLLGIAPCKNQIKNIGADENATHGGTNMNSVMTRRFCGMPSYPLDFPLKHPVSVLTDTAFERKTAKIMDFPVRVLARNLMRKVFRKLIK